MMRLNGQRLRQMDLGLYELYTIEPDPDTPEYERPPYNAKYSDKNFPDGWANVDPYLSYKSIFDGTIIGSKNPELIFTRTSRGNEQINHWVSNCMPRTLSGSNLIGVSQKQIDAYYMDNGQTVQEAKATGYYKEDGFTTSDNPLNPGGAPFLPANVSWQYAHREPRFYASIAYCGSIWVCASANEAQYRNKQIFYYRDLNDGKQGFKEDCPLTGIGFKKFVNDEDAFTQGGYRMDKTENTIRYAEMLLIYAEALNELNQGPDPEGNAYEAVRRVRERAGLPGLPEGLDYSAFKERIVQERKVELAFEGHRFWDLRRWRMAEEVLNDKYFHGIRITEDDDGNKIYDVFEVNSVPRQVFLEKHYLMPINQGEIEKNPKLLPNNGY